MKEAAPRRARVLERVEREVFARYRRSPLCGDRIVLEVPCESEFAFDREMDDLMVSIALIAEQHRCVSTSEVIAHFAGERWRW